MYLGSSNRRAACCCLCPRYRAKLHEVSVRVLDEDLPSTIGSRFLGQELRLFREQMRFPSVDLIDHQCKVSSTIVRVHRVRPFADNVQFLPCAESHPSTRKIKSRSRKRFELQHPAVKLNRSLDVFNMDGNVVQLGNLHALKLSRRCSPRDHKPFG